MRSNDWQKLAMAAGDVKPAWPLPTVVPKFSVDSIGGGRPFACKAGKCERWHAGVDLTKAPDGAIVVAPEDATVIGINRGWSEGSKAAFLRTTSGLFVVLGGFKIDSHKEFQIVEGAKVRKGDKLGRVLGSYGMIHLETYEAGARKANSVWWEADPPPSGLLNPTNYVERMVGDVVTLTTPTQRHQALAKLGYYKGDPAAAWSPASEAGLRLAQGALGLTVDGLWGPKTETAIRSALLASDPADAGTAEHETAAPEGGQASPGAATEDPAAPAANEPGTAVEIASATPTWMKLAIGFAIAGTAIGVGVALWRGSP